MTFKSKITQEILEKNKLKKENKDMKRINLETVKTVTIAVLVTGIVAFIGGMKYQEHQSSLVKTEAAAIVQSIKQAPSK